MAVEATQDTDPVTITPTAVRYSLTLDVFGGNKRGWLDLQRSDRRQDGTWIDDPRQSARKRVILPIGPAVDGLLALLPTILAKIGVTASYTDVRLQLRGSLNAAGVLDVLIVVQVRIGQQWIAKVIPSLTAFLTANQDIAMQVMGAWAALDGEIDAANAQNGWV